MNLKTPVKHTLHMGNMFHMWSTYVENMENACGFSVREALSRFVFRFHYDSVPGNTNKLRSQHKKQAISISITTVIFWGNVKMVWFYVGVSLEEVN